MEIRLIHWNERNRECTVFFGSFVSRVLGGYPGSNRYVLISTSSRSSAAAAPHRRWWSDNFVYRLWRVQPRLSRLPPDLTPTLPSLPPPPPPPPSPHKPHDRAAKNRKKNTKRGEREPALEKRNAPRAIAYTKSSDPSSCAGSLA